MKKIRLVLFACMLVLMSLSLTACARNRNGGMNETGQNSATSSAAETGTWENGVNDPASSAWEEENGTVAGETQRQTETTGEGFLNDLTDDISRGASDAADDLEGR